MKWFRWIGGVSLMALGVLGLFLPILQGWLLIALGALLLAREVPLFRRLALWVEARYPRLGGPLRRFRRRIGGEDEESRDGG